MLNICCLLEDSARRYPSQSAFVFMDTDLTYAQVNAAANQVANGLVKKGIKPGDKVAMSCLNLPYFPILYFGILKAGAVVVPLSILLKEDEIAYHLTDSEAKVYFCFEGTHDLPMGKLGYAGWKNVPGCKELIMVMAKPEAPSPYEDSSTFTGLTKEHPATFESYPTGAEDTAIIIYTSGTTGKPKGAELTHSNILHNTILSSNLVNSTSKDTQLIVLPLFHIFAMVVQMTAGIYKGMRNILLPRFDAEAVLTLMQKHKVTVFAGVPTMFWGLNHYTGDKFDFAEIGKNLRVACSGGASLPLQVLKEFEKRFNVPILEGYGMSEGSPVVTFNQIETGRKPGSIGTPVWGIEVKLVDENDNEVPVGEKGELLYRGHNVMKGYYNKPEANAETLRNGWMHSGDIATKDDDGFYYIVDRTKDMIIRGGLNVYPREIEEVMITHTAISMVAVIGIPNEKYGEEVKAYVVRKEGATASEDEIQHWIKEKIADYKYPRIVEFIDKLPMSATGKILKKELRS